MLRKSTELTNFGFWGLVLAPRLSGLVCESMLDCWWLLGTLTVVHLLEELGVRAFFFPTEPPATAHSVKNLNREGHLQVGPTAISCFVSIEELRVRAFFFHVSTDWFCTIPITPQPTAAPALPPPRAGRLVYLPSRRCSALLLLVFGDRSAGDRGVAGSSSSYQTKQGTSHPLRMCSGIDRSESNYYQGPLLCLWAV